MAWRMQTDRWEMCHLGACPILALKFAIVSFLLFPHNSVHCTKQKRRTYEGDFLLPTCYFNNCVVKVIKRKNWVGFQICCLLRVYFTDYNSKYRYLFCSLRNLAFWMKWHSRRLLNEHEWVVLSSSWQQLHTTCLLLLKVVRKSTVSEASTPIHHKKRKMVKFYPIADYIVTWIHVSIQKISKW